MSKTNQNREAAQQNVAAFCYKQRKSAGITVPECGELLTSVDMPIF